MENLKQLLAFGNKKLPSTTAIFNIGSATTCPSKAKGLCALADKCYAMKAEKQYPACKPYRDRQLAYWNAVTAEQFVDEFDKTIRRKKVKPNALRFNEAGDFYTQADVDKAELIARYLWNNFKVRAYAYTARRDLNYSGCKHLNIMGSFVISDQNHSAFIGVVGAKEHAKKLRGFYAKTAVCPGDCKKCSLCQVVKNTVVFCEMH